MIATKNVALPGGHSFVRYCGRGKPLLLLHAGIADSRMWFPQFEALCPKHRLIAPDLRGYGQSPLPEAPFSYMDDISRILDHFKVDRCWIVGISFGSWLAANYCLTEPDRVDGLVLLAATLGGFERDGVLRAFSREEAELLAAGDIPAATELNLRTWFDGPERGPSEVDPDLRTLVGRMQSDAFKLPEPGEVELIDEPIGHIDQYRRISCPLVLAVGDQDQPAVLRHVERLAQTIADARLIVMEGAGHMISLEKSEDINHLLQNTIASD